VLAVPIAPLLVLAVHDLHPKVVRAKRSTAKLERRFNRVQRNHETFVQGVDRTHFELLHAGVEQVLRDPALVYTESGAIRDDYRTRVEWWRRADEFRRHYDEVIEPAETEIQALGKDLKKTRKELNKLLRKMTKEFVKVTEMGGK